MESATAWTPRKRDERRAEPDRRRGGKHDAAVSQARDIAAGVDRAERATAGERDELAVEGTLHGARSQPVDADHAPELAAPKPQHIRSPAASAHESLSPDTVARAGGSPGTRAAITREGSLPSPHLTEKAAFRISRLTLT